MHLVEVLLGTYFKTNDHGDNGKHVDENQFPEIPFKADDKGHYKEIRKIEHILSCPQPLHIVHDDQVKVQVHDGQYPGQLELSSLVKVKGKDKEISRAEVYKCADIQAIRKIGDDTYEIGDQRKQDELVEPDHLPLSRWRIILP
jgi:hypothetical protein